MQQYSKSLKISRKTTQPIEQINEITHKVIENILKITKNILERQ